MYIRAVNPSPKPSSSEYENSGTARNDTLRRLVVSTSKRLLTESMKPMNFDFFASGTPEVESATAGLMPYRTVSGASPFECILLSRSCALHMWHMHSAQHKNTNTMYLVNIKFPSVFFESAI